MSWLQLLLLSGWSRMLLVSVVDAETPATPEATVVQDVVAELQHQILTLSRFVDADNTAPEKTAKIPLPSNLSMERLSIECVSVIKV